MLMADHGYALHSQTYIATEDRLADRHAELVSLIAGDARGWNASRADPAAAAELVLRGFPDGGLDLETQKLQAERQMPLMFSDLTDEHGCGWWDDASVSANIFFFSSRRRHTRCGRDWSSDVCSSDLKWQKTNYGKKTVEPHYNSIKPRIVIEHLLIEADELPIEYKIHVFNGKAKYLYVVTGRSEERRVGKECRSGWWTDG